MNQTAAENTKPSLIGGVAIIAGTAVGAGMFSLPVVSAGMGFAWSFACLLLSGLFMLGSAMLILETNLNYPVGSSFDTFVGKTLGPRWNLFNNLSLVFVLYILSYAFISGGGSIVSHTLGSVLGQEINQSLSGLAFALLIALVVTISSLWVSRLTSVLIAGMLLSFLWSALQLIGGVTPALLLDIKPGYGLFAFAALPFYLTSFGYHGSVPSLVKIYGKDPRRILWCLILGSLFSLLVYLLWLVIVLGQIPRAEFGQIIANGGNIGALVEAISKQQDQAGLLAVLNTFANLAVISSFLGVGLGLFDFIADKFQFADDGQGRLKTSALTFAPPMIASLFYPHGFILAIGYAGLCATVWGCLVPALAARASRRKFGNPQFRTPGGNAVIYLMLGYALLNATCHLLAKLGWLPEFS